MRQTLTHTGVAAHRDINHPLCQPNFLMLHTGKTDQNCQNIYWTTTHRARSTPANISCYPPMMQGPPLRLMVDPDAAPVANHTPVPVHWQEEVKAGLDRNVRLIVIEPVPVGDPVAYCHRMVICAKKDGKPWRTIDAQCQRHSGNTPHSIPVPPSQIGTCRHEENCL